MSNELISRGNFPVNRLNPEPTGNGHKILMKLNLFEQIDRGEEYDHRIMNTPAIEFPVEGGQHGQNSESLNNYEDSGNEYFNYSNIFMSVRGLRTPPQEFFDGLQCGPQDAEAQPQHQSTADSENMRLDAWNGKKKPIYVDLKVLNCIRFQIYTRPWFMNMMNKCFVLIERDT